MYASDAKTGGLSSAGVDALRYDRQPPDPEEVAGILRTLMPPGVRVLDVGCGTGSVTLIANRDKANSVLGIEPDPDRCAMARSRGLNVSHGFLDPAFIAEHGKFDVVMSSDVLEHMVDPGAGLELFKEALKPGGMILVSVPNVAHWSVRANLLRGRFRYAECGIMDATHLRWFTRETLVTLVESRGFGITDIRATAGYDLPVYTVGSLRKLPRSLKKPMIRAGLRTMPSVFGTQFVVAAKADS